MFKSINIPSLITRTPFKICTIVFVALITGLSLNWNLSLINKHLTEIALHETRGVFTLILITRQWNSLHQGVYVKVTDKTKPNPYLIEAERDIIANGVLFTKMNPAYMTREIADLTQLGTGVALHIASLKPVNPHNKPDAWEKTALEEFVKGKSEYYGFTETKRGLEFRYAGPLYMEKECYQCHSDMHNISNIRGTVTVSLPADPLVAMLKPQKQSVIIFHILVFLAISAIIWFTLTKLQQHLQERLEMEKLIKHQAYHDSLTGLPNRRMYERILQQTINKAEQEKTQLGIAFLDLDGFKNANDTYGHHVGDELLKQVAERLTSEVRNGDIVARQGGDEFVVLINGIEGAGEMVKIAERILKAIAKSFTIQGHEIRITTSIGISLFPRDGKDSTELIIKADSALYESKISGRNRYTFYHNGSVC